MSKNRGNPTIDQLELMGIVNCRNPECNAVNHNDETTCRTCGTLLDMPRNGQKSGATAIQARTMDKETEWPTPRPMTRGNASKRTKAEIMAFDKAKRENPMHEVIEQPMKLQLSGGGTYTPDLCIRTQEHSILVEVKGGYRGPGAEQGYERYKRAKYEWRQTFPFQLWTYDNKNKQWRVE